MIDLCAADLALHPLLRRVDKVTYSQIIDIFIRRRECFKTFSADIYLQQETATVAKSIHHDPAPACLPSASLRQRGQKETKRSREGSPRRD